MSSTATLESESLWGIGSANMILHGLTLASRALLMALAVYLSPAQLGVFGLLGVTVSLSLYLVGLDFNAYNARELLSGDLEAAPARIRDQFVFHGITYVAAFPLLLSVFFWGVLPWSLAPLFYVLLLLEHVAQELHRILVTLHRSLQASALLFVRGGVWVFPVLGLMAYDPRFRTVETVVAAWAAGAAISLFGAAYYLRDLPWKTGTAVRVDWAWLRRGLSVSLPLLCASLAFRGIVSADRFALQWYAGPEAVGVFTFYSGMRNAIQSLLDVGVAAVLRPRIIQAFHRRDLPLYHTLMRRMAFAIVGLGGGLCLLGAAAIGPILSIVDNPIYSQHLPAYWLLLIVTFVWALADIPQTTLYARQQDRAIVLSSVISFIVAIGANVVLVPRYGINGAALATLLALVMLGGLKALWAWSSTRVHPDER